MVFGFVKFVACLEESVLLAFWGVFLKYITLKFIKWHNDCVSEKVCCFSKCGFSKHYLTMRLEENFKVCFFAHPNFSWCVFLRYFAMRLEVGFFPMCFFENDWHVSISFTFFSYCHSVFCMCLSEEVWFKFVHCKNIFFS